MAQMKKYTLEQIKEKSNVTVGHNRTIAVNDGVFCCFLHGNEIAQFEPVYDDERAMKVCLDHCNWKTKTTQSAMEDFLHYFGCIANVSFAKDKMTVKHKAVDCKTYTINDCPRGVTFYCGV